MPPKFWTFTRRLAVVYVTGTVLCLALTLRLTGGHFCYSLDDPYIHLALAQHIAHGGYGINLGETTSPASSVLWPFLLVPFISFQFGVWWPLVLNIVFGLMTCVLMGRVLERSWLGNSSARAWANWLLAVLWAVAANLFGLTFTGMEHMLQVALAVGCAYGLLEAYDGRPIPMPALICAAIAPAVRYEDLALTLPVVIVCWAQGRRRASLISGAAAVLPLLGLSVFLHSRGLPLLPLSVLVKGGATTGGSLHEHVLQVMDRFRFTYSFHPGSIAISLMELCLFGLLWRYRADALRARVLGACALAIALMMVFGPYGWFGRYDVYMRLFATMVVFSLVARVRRFPTAMLAAGLCVVAVPYIRITALTPYSCRAVYEQQYQMHRFVNDYYRGDVAVNDLGWVSFDRRQPSYVLDLVGLASPESAFQVEKGPAWLDEITRRHHVGLAMIYAAWYPEVPPSWTKVAVLHENFHGQKLGLASETVQFFATTDAEASRIRPLATAFARTLPPGAEMTVFPDVPEGRAIAPNTDAVSASALGRGAGAQ